MLEALRAGARRTVVAAPVLLALAAPLAAAAVCDPSRIFADDFESGGELAWGGGSAAIAAARASADGPTSIPIAGVLVTYVKPAIGADPAGFVVQAEQAGPALFVAVDPVTLVPVPVAGDGVHFTVSAMATESGMRRAAAIAGFGRSQQERCLDPLVQEVSAAANLVSGLGSYETELIALEGLVTSPFGASGTGHVAADIDTAGLSSDPDLELRLSASLQDELDIAENCSFALLGTPLWRFNSIAQPSAWRTEDLDIGPCPAPTVVSAVATSATSVEVTFDRRIEPSSVAGDGSQFAFDNGLTASAAAVAARKVTVTTSAQTGGVSYTVTVAGSVTDLLATGVGSPNQALFSGFGAPATARINEVNANILNGCDLIELRVLTSGSLTGFQLFERDSSVLEISGLSVAAGDLVVIHFDGGDPICNPGGALNETTSPNQHPTSSFATNFDTAYDWYVADTGLTNTTNVLTLYDADDTIVDAVLLANALSTCSPATASEDQANLVAGLGHWEQIGGGLPAGGFVDDDFCANAVQDLDGTGTTSAGTTIGRDDDSDTDTASDWAMAGASWGTLNSGQSP